MKAKNPLPATPKGWLVEIAAAYQDAREAIPFGPLVGQPFSEAELFHLAPVVTLKFRGLRRSGRALGRATEAALTSYVANHDAHQAELSNAHLSFAFCYLASHYGLGLLTAFEAEDLMAHIERNSNSLARLVNRRTSIRPLQPTPGVRLRSVRQQWRARRG